VFATAGALLAQVAPADNIPNWSVPETWSPSRAAGGIQTMTDVSEAIPFVAISPCRIADTRAGQGFSGQAGPPGLTSFTNRTFQISGSPGTLPAPPAGCPANAVPPGADAVSVQLTVVFPTSAGNLVAWQAGATQPLVSVINWDAGTVALGSGTIIPLSFGGALTVRLNTAAAGQGAQLVIDINGYFSDETLLGQFFDLHGFYQGGTLAHFYNQSVTGINSTIWAEALSSSSGTSGVYGQAQATGGHVYGGLFTTNSTSFDAAGVKGVSGNGDPLGSTGDCGPCYTAGVRGLNNTGNGYGVLGITRDRAAVAGVLLQATGETVSMSGYLGADFGIDEGSMVGPDWGVFAEGDIGATGGKFFVEPHPTDPAKTIRYVALEGPEFGTYFRGKGRFRNGLATIAVPEDFRLVTDAEGLSIQVTPIGDMATVAVVSIGLDRIVVKGSRNVEFFYTVNGVRSTHRNLDPIAPGYEFVPRKAGAKMPAHLSDGQKRLLIQNGTYNPDGTVNMETAKRLGWDRTWVTEGPVEEPAPSVRPNNHN
jgi:hypothetical protein